MPPADTISLQGGKGALRAVPCWSFVGLVFITEVSAIRVDNELGDGVHTGVLYWYAKIGALVF